LKQEEEALKLYVPKAQLKEVYAALAEEGVRFEVTDHCFSW